MLNPATPPPFPLCVFSPSVCRARREDPWTGSACLKTRRSPGLRVSGTYSQPCAPTPAKLQVLPWLWSTASPNTPKHRARGRPGLASLGSGPGGDKQRGLEAGAGGCGRRGRVGKQEGERHPARGPGARGSSGRNGGSPLDLHSASELRKSARAQPGSLGPEGGRGQGCATGDGDTQAH